jgi:hypothetical protein
MKRSIGAAVIAGSLALAGPAAIDPAAAASSKVVSISAAAASTDLGARRHRHYRRYAYRPAYPPYYYDRPTYYRPYPYSVPAPFFLGFAFGPTGW